MKQQNIPKIFVPQNSGSRLAFLLSLPRSGSTLLTAMMDRRKGVICMPESSFPQVLGTLSKKEREDPRWLADLYLGSTMVPTPITFSEAVACMRGSDQEILISLGLALAQKSGRDPSNVEVVLWKTTRTIGMNKGPLSTAGKFVVLRRHPLNVFESQFRVGFGENNRRPWRFALFLQSYEHAFSRLPGERGFQLDYEDIPQQMHGLLDFLGVQDQGEWEVGTSSFEKVAQSCSWLTEITGEFNNKDHEKRERLDPVQKRSLDLALFWTKFLRPFMGPIRDYFDRRSLEDIRAEAQKHYKSKQ